MNIPRNPFLLQNESDYSAWRTEKFAHYPTTVEKLVVPIRHPAKLTVEEKSHLLALCQKTNLVVYQIDKETPVDKSDLRALGSQLGLENLDANMCADEDGITALQVMETGHPHDYIPYSDRQIHWHTDGYYNTLNQQIQGLLLHCVRPAPEGGENKLLDHEIAYIRLRDENPNYIKALMQDDVMTIPPNVENGQELRPARTGAVFSVRNGKLHMRYTERKYNILWKDDPDVKAALECLRDFIHSDSVYIFRHKLSENQGLICNNVLHDRSAFTDSETQKRLLYRLRFFDRILET
jgi:alpha-ketoglutarate-dependent taurine dioxygenase